MKGLLVFFLAVLAVKCESEPEVEGFVPKFPGKLEESKTLKKFVKLVEEHKLNVTVLISTAEKWNDGTVREAMTLAVTLPTNDVKFVKESKLTKDVAKQFLKVATSENLSAQGIKINVDDPDLPLKTITNNPYGWPTENAFTIAMESVFGQRVYKDDNFGAQYTFIVPSEAGNTTTKVYYGDLKVEIVEEEDFGVAQIEVATEAVKSGYFQYEWDDIAQYIVSRMEKAFPDVDWQVGIDVGKDSWINSKKYLKLKNLETEYTIFAIE